MATKSSGKTLAFVILLIVIVTTTLVFFGKVHQKYPMLAAIITGIQPPSKTFSEFIETPMPTPLPTATLTPKPLTLAEMNQRYGPCAVVPTLMYHHIQNSQEAEKKGQTYLSVDPKYLSAHLAYLKEKGYQVIPTKDLIEFFNNGTPLARKSVILTFDDGYEDFYTNAFPILREFGAKATVFLATGLAQNPDYLTWEQAAEMNNSQLVSIANHTWSHYNTASKKEVVEKEISTADIQLAERNLNQEKVFSYPYGSDSNLAENYLRSINYNLAFTTQSGSVLCKKLNLSLPRIRIGNAPLSAYGL